MTKHTPFIGSDLCKPGCPACVAESRGTPAGPSPAAPRCTHKVGVPYCGPGCYGFGRTWFERGYVVTDGEWLHPLAAFFREEEAEWGRKGDYENWSPERSAIGLIRHLRASVSPPVSPELREAAQRVLSHAEDAGGWYQSGLVEGGSSWHITQAENDKWDDLLDALRRVLSREEGGQ